MKRNLFFFVFGLLFLSNVLGKTIKTSSFVVDLTKGERVFFEQDSLNLTFKDTLKLIDDHIKKADYNKNNGLYALAYDQLWKAMPLAEALKDLNQLASIHNELGLLYGIYGKNEKAIEHKLKVLDYVKRNKSKNKKIKLGSAYYSLAIQYRKSNELNKCLTYLDSCSFLNQKNKIQKENPYVFTEKGNVFLQKGELEKAETFLLKAKRIFEKEEKTFLVIVYKSLGDLYLKKEDKVRAIDYYKKSLKVIDTSKTHTNFETSILKEVAFLYKEQQEVEKAYDYLEKSYKVADSLFSMKSESNSQLFKIKNKYEETLLKKDRRINEQKHVIEKKKRVQVQLLFAIAFIVFVVIGLLFLYYHKAKVRRLQVEKAHAATQIQHDKDKLNAVLETKSKELTVSALQLIEKDKNIDQLLDVIKKEAPDVHRKLEKEIVSGNKDLWERFNLRFTEVNTDFYNRLRKKHETLTPTEQKHCALIKLKFDSKEMARLLNISVNSVHISRHRIRKKIGLQRDDDLSNYIGGI